LEISDRGKNAQEEEDDLDIKERSKRGNVDYKKFENIPVTVDTQTGNYKKDVPKPMTRFDECTELGEIVLSNLKHENFTLPTPVQKHGIPIICAHADCMASAQTGSGKTIAFVAPIVGNLLKDGIIPRPFFAGKMACGQPLCLILAPTRELAIQIDEQVFKMTKQSYLKSFAVFGGDNYEDQAAQIGKGQIDILSATPGRLLDMVDASKISLAFIKYLAFDEADNMLDLGFEDVMRQICQQRDMPPKEERQTVMFSATFPEKIQDLAKSFMREFVFLKIGKVGSTTTTITQEIKWVENRNKKQELLKDLAACTGKVIVFVSRRQNAGMVSNFLKSSGLEAGALHGHQDQYTREEAILNFRDDQFRVLVATSVAARGLDFPEIEQVINYDMPPNIEVYTHRIGRCGRIGTAGKAIAYFNSTSHNMAGKVVAFLRRSDQDIPHWLQMMSERNPRKFRGNKGEGWESQLATDEEIYSAFMPDEGQQGNNNRNDGRNKNQTTQYSRQNDNSGWKSYQRFDSVPAEHSRQRDQYSTHHLPPPPLHKSGPDIFNEMMARMAQGAPPPLPPPGFPRSLPPTLFDPLRPPPLPPPFPPNPYY